MPIIKGLVQDIAGQKFDQPDNFFVVQAIENMATSSAAIVTSELCRVPMKNTGGVVETPMLRPGPARIILEGGSVHGTSWKVTLPDQPEVNLGDLIASVFKWSPYFLELLGQEVANWIAELEAAKQTQLEQVNTAVNAVIGAIKWAKDALASDTDLNTVLTQGVYKIPSWTIAASLTNRPADGAWINPGALIVYESGHDQKMVHQTWISMPERMNFKSYRLTRYRFADGTWSAWVNENPDDISTLSKDADLNTVLTQGVYKIPSWTIAASLTNRPADGAWINPGALIVYESGHDQKMVHQTWISMPERMNFKSYRLTRYRFADGTWSAWVNENPTWSFPKSKIQMWGDSEVQGGYNTASGDLNLPKQISLQSGKPTDNMGNGGWCSRPILIRAGVVKIWAKPQNGAILASGITNLVTSIPINFARTMDITWCKLNGVYGTFRMLYAGGAIFVANEGQLTADKPQAEFLELEMPSAALFDTSATHIFLFGTNDWLNRDKPGTFVPDQSTADHIIAEYQRAIDAVPSLPERHVLVAGVKTQRATLPGDENDLFVQYINGHLKEKFAPFFVDRQAYLASELALTEAGITPTEIDKAQIAAGLIPPSAFTDDVHILGNVLPGEAKNLWVPALKQRGWA
ncbi:pyocin knob domain-containing protein [Staphylococcus chromogenes]|nr:pyocin knob domain-containing protein [Staphylococcus chromogenes]